MEVLVGVLGGGVEVADAGGGFGGDVAGDVGVGEEHGDVLGKVCVGIEDELAADVGQFPFPEQDFA